MDFSGTLFIFYFLPLTIAGYFLIGKMNQKLQFIGCVALSLFIYESDFRADHNLEAFRRTDRSQRCFIISGSIRTVSEDCL